MSANMSQTIEINLDLDTKALAKGATETIAYVMAAIFCMNVFDATATIFWVTAGFATEANPLMDELLRVHPVAFMTVKLLLIGLGISLLWMRREHWLSRAGCASLFVVYVGISLYHMLGVGWVTGLV